MLSFLGESIGLKPFDHQGILKTWWSQRPKDELRSLNVDTAHLILLTIYVTSSAGSMAQQKPINFCVGLPHKMYTPLFPPPGSTKRSGGDTIKYHIQHLSYQKAQFFISESWSVVIQPRKNLTPPTIYLFHNSAIYMWPYSTIQPIFLAKSSDKNKLVGGWTRPSEKYQIGTFPNFRVDNSKKNNLKRCHHHLWYPRHNTPEKKQKTTPSEPCLLVKPQQQQLPSLCAIFRIWWCTHGRQKAALEKAHCGTMLAVTAILASKSDDLTAWCGMEHVIYIYILYVYGLNMVENDVKVIWIE